MDHRDKVEAVIFDLITTGNFLISEDKLSRADAKNILGFLKKADKIFNFIFWPKEKEKIPEEVLELVKEREKYRQQGSWQKADKIRKKIRQMGYWIEDTEKGPKIKKL